MTVSVCIGSSCHLRGSYDVRKIFEEQIAAHGLSDKVNLEVAFCLGKCKDGVTIKIDDEIITGLSKENAKDVFKEKILSVLSKGEN